MCIYIVSEYQEIIYKAPGYTFTLIESLLTKWISGSTQSNSVTLIYWHNQNKPFPVHEVIHSHLYSAGKRFGFIHLTLLNH